MALSRVGLVGYDTVSNAQIKPNTIIPEDVEDRSITSVKLAIPQVFPYSSNVTGNVSVTRSLAVGFTDGRVPQANLDVKGNVYITGNTHVRDHQRIQFGTGKDLAIYHDGGQSYIDNGAVGGIYVRTASTKNAIVMEGNAGIRLYYNGSQTLNTVSGGVGITGDLGIGVTSPSAQLAIAESAQAQVRVAGVIGGTGQTTTGTNSYQNTSPQFDFANAQNWRITLANNVTFGRPWNCSEGQTGSIFVGQDTNGSRTASFSDDWLFPAGTAPTLTTTASANDRIDYIVQKVHHGGQAVGIQAVVTLDLK